MKAYVVQEEYEGHCVVVFAKHRATAQANGASELNCEFPDVTCRRRPQFDQYAEQGYVPKQVLVEAGWWFECHHCGTVIDSSLEDEEGEELSPVYRKNSIYCSQKCVEGRQAEIDTQNQKFARFQVKVQEIFGNLEYTWTGQWPAITMIARFQLPGCQYPSEYRDQNGDGQGVFLASACDQEAAKKWLKDKGVKV